MDLDDSPESRMLQERLAVAERNEHCLFSACRLVALVAFIGLFGLGYAAVLLPEFFENSSHMLIQFFSALGLGSAICLLLFVGLWLWYRSQANHIREECRSAVTTMIEVRLRPGLCRSTPIVGHAPYVAICRVESGTIVKASEKMDARKAS